MRRRLAGRWVPAIMVAISAALIGGGAFALASGSRTIKACAKKHGGALYIGKCAKHDKRLSWNKVGPSGARGPAGPAGAQGQAGATGPAGPTGPQGPGATTLTFDANATASPTPTVVGTLLGATISADCKVPSAGQARLETFLSTSDGSWTAAFAGVNTNFAGSTSTTTENAASARDDLPAGTLTSPVTAATITADVAGPEDSTADSQIDIVQTLPQKGHMVWHLNAKTTSTPASQQCHFVAQSFPSG